MSFKPFTKIRLINEDDLTPKNINTLQDNIASAFGQILGKDTLDSIELKNIVLTSGTVNKVPHLLGRKLNGYIVTRCHGGFPWIYDMQDNNESPHLLLYLVSATNITVNLLVY